MDSWEEAIKKTIDAKAKTSLQPPSILREMDQHCPRGNRLAYTTMAQFQASTRDPRDEFSASSAWHSQDKSPRFSHPHFLRSESGETSEKNFRKEKKKQRRLDHERAQKNSTPAASVYAPNVASTACKDLSHITYFNYNKKDHYATKCPKPRKDSNAED